jgi:hypothetical protein
LPTSFSLVVRQYPADGQGAHRRPVRGSFGGVGDLVAAAESLDRCCRGRAEASDGRLLRGLKSTTYYGGVLDQLWHDAVTGPSLDLDQVLADAIASLR